ncbi:probable dolichyl pyrophosphate Man9GlcNAc2 alpha-1,3-glucosyltransferase [Zea mays]|uniref:Alpha-1,3-glucosyltransferase n=1 Tax=Zea mays TaxID=4577 RepID=A0A1D6Q134_MAIZE|nr:probable dolichyl pyrophosphate Man9GlcNAc2 alpha-1,3-glucosyltransferase [Zea mays]XP_020407439.1 probable dolichyl pyrophosphate Man9GlcNAc2 alpha-1,3-glucosyltransferase [Zea mays]AQK52326.1 putative dolichyl pyrophosphate Man9GlcNAc2 alpha-13-glucosyltransferase [Zea mays]|eukprot:XP_008678565.1 probable dolichyl pyrophosphate Man9GlcNAc2 alpha-1,3-glucosyltransferase [Zea mays]
MWLLAMVLISPCLVLIDHGHFQYNCISLGLTLGAIAGVLSRNELVAAALFTLAINHKQVDRILDKENFILEELLDEDEINQECKALNSILINL